RRNESGPLLRPLWYDAPEFEPAHTVADEYQLGTEIFVAPVLDPGRTTRDILLPPGEWCDAWTGTISSGGCLLRNHPGPCPGIPVFVRARNSGLAATLHRALSGIKRGSVPSGITTATYSAGLDRNLSA
ncbi:MAG: hypothetical protein ACUVWX_12670, partial [Kiritimatiellia bacterium]